MAAMENEIKKFVQLLEQKKIKDAKLYIDKIDQEDPDFQTEQIIAKGLQRCLVQKKTTPMGMTSALYIYKQIFIRALFEFMETEAFDQKIHKFVYDTCQYNLSSAQVDTRGQNYFKDTMKAETSQTNTTLGCTIVSLALELIQCMASWFPIDPQYDQPSIFARYYEKLIEKKVKFPTKNQIIKPEQEKKFRAKYEAWLEKLERENQQEQREKPSISQDKKKVIQSQIKNEPIKKSQLNKQGINQNTNNVASSKVNIKQQQPKKAQAQKKTDDMITKSRMADPKNIQQNKKVEAPAPIIQVIEAKKNQTANNSKKQQPRSSIQNKNDDAVFILEDQSQKPQGNFILEDPTNKIPQGNLFLEDPIKPQKVQDSKQKLKPNQIDPKIAKKKLEQQEREKKDREARAQLIIQQALKMTGQEKKMSNDGFSNSGIFKYSRVQENNGMPRRVQRKMQLPSSAPKKSLSPHIQFGKQQLAKMNEGIRVAKQQNLRKSAIRQINTSSVINSRIGNMGESQVSRYETPRDNSQHGHSSMRTPIRNIESDLEQQNKKNKEKLKQKQQRQRLQREKAIKEKSRDQESKSPNKKFYKTENRQVFNQQGEQKKKRSLPKTEKKNLGKTQNLVGFLNRSPNMKRNILTDQKTLSDFRNLKNKKRAANPYIEDYYSRQPLLQKIEKLRIKQQVIRFLPQYFDPITTQWNSLLAESLRINCNNDAAEPSSPFLRNSQIELQLLKLPNYYTLRIRNLRNKSIKVGFSQALQAKFGNQFSCRIKIKDSDHKRLQQVTVWVAEPNQYIDIRFDFSTNDANFKFLLIVLAIQQKINSFYLPITLLDQGVIDKYIDMQQVNQFIDFYGVLFKSTPIQLSLGDQSQAYMSLPNFMSKNSNMNSQIIGYMTYQIPLSERVSSKINIFIKKCDQYQNLYEVYSLTDRRRQENIDFSKVLIELLCFLLAADQ